MICTSSGVEPKPIFGATPMRAWTAWATASPISLRAISSAATSGTARKAASSSSRRRIGISSSVQRSFWLRHAVSCKPPWRR
jgi:hypothetical protein